jgi:hypothetical protein
MNVWASSTKAAAWIALIDGTFFDELYMAMILPGSLSPCCHNGHVLGRAEVDWRCPNTVSRPTQQGPGLTAPGPAGD